MAVVASPARPLRRIRARAAAGVYPEPPSAHRSAFRRDCDRIIHSSAFRRLAYKTQVFVFHEGDHFRTRLTHTLEVTQIARSLARALGLDEDLAEACALGHDLGHPPFGHAGERALDECLPAFGGFDHNAQTLARRDRAGAALCRLRRAQPDLGDAGRPGQAQRPAHRSRAAGRLARYRERGLPRAIAEYSRAHDLELWSHPSAEAQVGAIADDIAYDAHDIDDGLRAEMFALDDLADLPVVGDILREIAAAHPRLEPARRAHELVRRLITRMIEDVIAQSRRQVVELEPESVDDVRAAGRPLVGFSAAMAEADRAIKDFLYPRLYRHARITRIMGEAEQVVRRLFRALRRCAGRPAAGMDRRAAIRPTRAGRALQIADYIAGMTDRYAMIEHARLFGETPELR